MKKILILRISKNVWANSIEYPKQYNLTILPVILFNNNI